MSDPVTNSEVEDVLSSIRRLVGGNKSSKTEKQSNTAPERLVLSPQLRVADPHGLDLEPSGAIEPTEGWYEFEEPPLLGPEPAETPEQDNDEIEEPAHLEGDEPSQTIQRPAENSEASATDAVEVKNEHSGENGKADPLDMSAFQILPDPAPVHTPPPKFSELTAKIAALETAIARTSDQWEPDGDDEDAYAGSQSPALRWQDHVELDGRGSPMSAVALTDVAQVSVPDEEVVDEEMLRELVADIVRQELKGSLVAQIVREELQGDLGERITRNVRKLVRREIQRALTARELD